MKRESMSRMPEAAQAENWATRCRDATTMTVDDHPLGVTLGVFAVGLSLGVMVGAALVQPSHSRGREVAESLGRRMLEALQQMPSSVSHYLKT